MGNTRWILLAGLTSLGTLAMTTGCVVGPPPPPRVAVVPTGYVYDDVYYTGGYYRDGYWYWHDHDGHYYRELREAHERRAHDWESHRDFHGREGHDRDR